MEPAPWHLWGIDPGFVPGVNHSRFVSAFISKAEERKYNERLSGRPKDRERSLSSYSHG